MQVKNLFNGKIHFYQEALSNTVRHVGATKANVHFCFADKTALLEIQDNGKGMNVVPNLITLTEQGHYGLAGMRERAEAVNGEFELRSGSDKGTMVIVKIPINKNRNNSLRSLCASEYIDNNGFSAGKIE